jgi:DUF4097 and DUF4098 domain-containing protein YvlB
MTVRAVLVLALSIAAASPAVAQQTETFDRIVKIGAGADVIVRNISGDTRIAGSASGQIEVHAIKRAPTAARLSNTGIDVTSTANRVEIRLQSHDQRNSEMATVDFDIRVPPDASVDVQTVSGALRVSNVKGSLRATTVSGGLTLEGDSKIAAAASVSGAIHMTNAGGDAAAEVHTVSGDITISGLAAHAVEFHTVSGAVRLTGATAERISFRSVSGGFNYEGALSPGGRYDLESHSGDIHVAIPDRPGFEVDATSFSGDVVIDYPIRNEATVNTSGRGARLRLARGTYGDGSAVLHLRTFSGAMRITKR